jgi:hypothetical protein
MLINQSNLKFQNVSVMYVKIMRFVVVLVSFFRQLPMYNSDARECYSRSLYMIDMPSH